MSGDLAYIVNGGASNTQGTNGNNSPAVRNRRSRSNSNSNGGNGNMGAAADDVLKETAFLKTGYKKEQLHCHYWRPGPNKGVGVAGGGGEEEEEVILKGLVFLCHGLGEHLSWYDDLARRLAASGLLAFGHDHVGHGLSEGRRGAADDVGVFVGDVLFHAAKMKHKYPGLPCFIYGHSMGGMIAVKAVLKNPAFFRGCVLEGPFIRANKKNYDYSDVTYYAAALLNYLPGSQYVPIAEIKVEEVTRDDDIQRLFSADPANFKGYHKLGIIVPLMKQLREFATPGVLEQVDVPLLIMQGEEDVICPKEGAQLLNAKAKNKDKSLIMFPGARHHLLLELPEVRTQVMNETVQWITQRLTVQGPRIKMEPMKMSPRAHERLREQLREEEEQRRREQQQQEEQQQQLQQQQQQQQPQ